ncbi:MAG: MGMT family protein [Blastocatellia bacterium]|nr:MGMT family protein [Blastocatellia bacterium]MCS7156804.1 MGMT family protein [Blastocatellia bacterium]MCX7752762.1 MGMT family protein [Blastocatellia bacterium]MDW8167495.1 MGMT family protein [Acidobacteriota bacterium]MDW8256842.1 MGMT family protein [Acidobacteriota bacterium]
MYRLVRRIPRGRVASYGDIAALCRANVSARVVGWALAVCPPDVPWHRVVNRDGRLTIGRRALWLQQLQRDLLRAEGVAFLAEDQVAIEAYRWRPRRTVPSRRSRDRKIFASGDFR